MGVYAFIPNPSTQEAKVVGVSEFEASLDDICSEFQNSQGYSERPCLKNNRLTVAILNSISCGKKTDLPPYESRAMKETADCSGRLFQLNLEVPPPLMFPMTVTPLGRDQDCSLKIREPDVPAPWFLDPGGWSKTAAVSLYFIFPGICTLSL
ncbi:hypothetical protein STEG23_001123 [Scotinomys teguina]